MKILNALKTWALIAMVSSLQLAHASTYVAFDNGGIGYDWGSCISGPNQCGATNGETFTVYNQFTLKEMTHVVGFQNWNGHGAASTYIQTHWSIWTGSPMNAPAPVYAGTSVANIQADQSFNRATVGNLDINLPGGTYWLGINHETTEPWTYIVPSTWRSGAILGYGHGGFIDNYGQMAFQVLATSVPEPSSIALLCIGLSYVCWRSWKRRMFMQV